MKTTILRSMMIVLASIFTLNMNAEIYSGECGAEGKNITWILDTETGLLSITGDGQMKDYNTESPWYLYRGCIKRVEIEKGITSIGNFAFDGCYEMTSIALHEDLRTIGTGAFSSCNSLVSITLPDGLIFIAPWAFQNCENLASINIPTSVETIQNDAFCGCTSLPIEDNIRYAGTCAVEVTDETQTIYQLREGTTHLLGYTFTECKNMKKITLSSSLKMIGSYAFNGCTNLATVVIPDHSCLTYIGSGVFYGCSSLTSIPLPPSVLYIGKDAFEKCSSLPAEDDVVYAGICAVGVSDKTKSEYKVREGTTYLLSTFRGCTRLTSIIMPSSLRVIGYMAFGETFLTSFTIPNGVTEIGEFAFSKSILPSSISVPSTVRTIREGAFDCSFNIKSITLTEGLETIEAAFCSCNELTSITIPASVKNIVGNIVKGCMNMYSIVVDERNTVYDSRDNCNAILETSTNTLISACNATTFPSNVSSIGDGAFNGCLGISYIDIPNSVTSIGEFAFAYCENLETVAIPESVTSIGKSAFYHCTSLPLEDNIYYADTWAVGVSDKTKSEYKVREGTTHLLCYSFIGCENMMKITLPSSLVYIGNNAFQDCSNLESITTFGNVTSIEDETFAGCAGLTSIVIPNGVTSIGQSAFIGCSGLTSIEIPNGVTSIGLTAFAGCTSLTSVEIPNSVASIESFAFSNCSGLNSIKCDATTPPTCGYDVFSFVNKSACTLYVPAESVEAYKSADQWKEFYNIEGFATGIDDVNITDINTPKSYFDMNGREIPALQKGLNIVKKANGQTIKVVIK